MNLRYFIPNIDKILMKVLFGYIFVKSEISITNLLFGMGIICAFISDVVERFMTLVSKSR